jgi:hypothetical protein
MILVFFELKPTDVITAGRINALKEVLRRNNLRFIDRILLK